MTTNENKKEFDRSICMTFFGDCREHIKRLERNFGIEKAYQIQSAIIDYGLDGIKPTEDDILLYLPEPMLNQIDNNQAKRAQAFSSEDLEMSEKILVTHRDRPELSQEKLAKLLGISKGKVNKTLQKWKNGEYEGLINIDTNSNNNTNPNTYTNVTVTVTDQRDRLVEVTTDSPTAQTASTMPTEKVTETEYNSLEFDCSMISNDLLRQASIPNTVKKYLNKNDGVITQEIYDEMFNDFNSGATKCKNINALHKAFQYIIHEQTS